ncbi:MAG: hypothetical protein U1D67_07245, partial [Dehalococcoidia bacterium]|nr:hypothetical protein [Dehalococcoidia bacterium]
APVPVETPRVETKATPAPVRPTAAPTRPPEPAATPRPETRPYYEGKTIEMVVGSAAGGPTDMHARAIGMFLPKYIPGNPRVVIRNVPGGSGTVAINNIVEKTKPDGMTLVAGASSSLNNQRIGLDIVRYDLRNIKFIDSLSRAESLLFIHKEALPRLTNPSAEPVVVGSREGTESWQAMPLWGREFLGWNVRWILGFGGTSELELALQRREIDMFGTADASIPERLKAEGLIEVIGQMGSLAKGKWPPRPDYPDVPVMANMLMDKGIKGVPWDAYRGWAAPGSALDRWLGAPPGTPDNIRNILIDAVKKMEKDPKFDDLVKKTITPVYTMNYGDDILEVVKELLDSPPEVVDYPLQLQKKFGIIK